MGLMYKFLEGCNVELLHRGAPWLTLKDRQFCHDVLPDYCKTVTLSDFTPVLRTNSSSGSSASVETLNIRLNLNDLIKKQRRCITVGTSTDYIIQVALEKATNISSCPWVESVATFHFLLATFACPNTILYKNTVVSSLSTM
ncbi:hypothetical protein TNCV_1535581 [Trichonephila clavipes]|uniref:Uncharacterized protein n=1 Tax=Trichonephila clavipes TaxID=2585209 RepID=A0A8X6URR5_TRICX|nr:hypothetical protein TNCV_1535581 [Trichonephila clavipes]